MGSTTLTQTTAPLAPKTNHLGLVSFDAQDFPRVCGAARTAGGDGRLDVATDARRGGHTRRAGVSGGRVHLSERHGVAPRSRTAAAGEGMVGTPTTFHGCENIRAGREVSRSARRVSRDADLG